MKKKLLIIFGAVLLFAAQGWGQQTWNLTPTMTAVLDANGTLTISTTKAEGEAMPAHPWSSERSNIFSVVIKDGVTTIDEFAFYECTNLTNIIFSNTTNTIGVCAFAYCSNLTGTLIIPNSVHTIGDNAFANCSGLTGNLTIPNSVIEIGSEAFFGCTNFNGDLVIPNSVTKIGDYAFEECSGFSGKLVIGNSVNYIGDVAFGYCSGFTGNLIIPNSVSTIGACAFYQCNGFTGTLSIGSSVKVIGYEAFQDCSGFTGDLIIPNSVDTIGSWAFYRCSGFTGNLYIGNSVTYIGQSAFNYCSGFTGILTIGKSVKTIGEFAFNECSGLTGDFIIPNSVNTIGMFAFSYCRGLTGNLIIPNSVTSIGAYAFQSCSGLTGKLVIPNSVTKIEEAVFLDCSGLTGDLIIPNSITNIGNSSFAGCDGLTGNLIIPKSITNIGAYGFGWCGGFKDVTVGWSIPLSVPVGDNTGQGNIFYASYISNMTLHVPTGTYNLYKYASVWKDFGKIVEYDPNESSTCSADCSFPNLPTTNNFYDATCCLFSRGLLTGITDASVTAAELDNSISRKNMADIAFRGVYSVNGKTVPSSVPSDNYPLIYSDLNGDGLQAVKALLYLEYGDGISPFDRNRTLFQPDNTIARVHVLKVLLETFNIQPDLSNTANPFPGDADMEALKTNNPQQFGYMRKAFDLGIIKEGRPFADCKLGEAYTMLYRIMTGVEAGAIPDPNPASEPEKKYFEPVNMTIQNLAMGPGMELGNFNHYTKSSFAMAGVVPLDFTHTYNSYNADLPDIFFGMYNKGQEKIYTYEPLGPGWSHSYHSFVTLVDNRMIVHWGGGTIHVYGSNGTDFVCESSGVYDKASISGSDASAVVTITTKSQIEYKFRKNVPGSLNDGVFKLWTIKDRNGNTLTVNYESGTDNVERISSVSDGNRSLNFSYKSGTNLISSVSDPMGRVITFTYIPSMYANEGYILSAFDDAKKNRYSYSYLDNNHPKKSRLLAEIKLPKGNSIKNEYDANRRLTQSTGSLNGVPKSQTNVSVASAYSPSSKTMSSTVQIAGGSTSRNYNYKFNANNNVTDLTGNQGLSISASYGDNKNPVLPTAVSSNSGSAAIQYDGNGNVTQITQKSLTGSDTRVTSIAYNSRNDVISVTDPKGNTTSYDYDGKGNLTAVRAPDGSATSFSVNAQGLPVSVTNPENIVTGYSYNTYGNLQTTTIQALGLSSTIEYDNASRVTSVKDFLNRTTAFAYDANDNLLTETDAANHKTSYDYDANDNLLKITNAKGGATSMTYDNTTDWLTSVEFGGSTKRYDYNNDGSLKTFTKPDGKNLSSTYDDLGRITFDGVTGYTYDGNHRLATLAKDGKTLSYEYDGFNQVTGVTCSDLPNNKVSYTYDSNGNVMSITYPGGKKVSYTYDNLNRMKTVTDWYNKTITYNYLKDGRPQSVSYPNGMSVTYAYDNAGRQTGKTVKRQDNSVIASYGFVLDNAGNIQKETRTEPYGDTPLPSENVNYAYNSANRITQAGSTSFTFDLNGNTLTRGSSSYSYDDLDKLTSGDGFNFEYDGLGNIRSNGVKRFMIDISGMGNVIAETNMSGSPTAYYVYGAGGLEARILPDGATEYYVSDYRGSVVAMTDATTSANITHKYQYDDFGKVTQKQESDENNFRYVGKYGVMYAGSNLYYMRARFYDPTIGRFLSEDPIWSANLYPYADNNPVMGVDPRGLSSSIAEIDSRLTAEKNLVASYIQQINEIKYNKSSPLYGNMKALKNIGYLKLQSQNTIKGLEAQKSNLLAKEELKAYLYNQNGSGNTYKTDPSTNGASQRWIVDPVTGRPYLNSSSNMGSSNNGGSVEFNSGGGWYTDSNGNVSYHGDNDYGILLGFH